MNKTLLIQQLDELSKLNNPETERVELMNKINGIVTRMNAELSQPEPEIDPFQQMIDGMAEKLLANDVFMDRIKDNTTDQIDEIRDSYWLSDLIDGRIQDFDMDEKVSDALSDAVGNIRLSL